jgi:hypothetical protein
MTGLAAIVAQGGIQQFDPTGQKLRSPRRKGLKQGGGMFLFGLLVVPILAILSEMLKFNDEIVALAAVVLFLGGILRMVYALVFESGNPMDKTLEENVYQTAQKLMNKKPNAGALPPGQSIPVDAYAPPQQPRAMNWRDTNDLEPSSVTDETTKLLNKNQ